MMTNQEVFNKAYAHASRMKNLSQENVVCKYRSVNGESCLIGGFIPDERYEPAMEGVCVNALSISYTKLMIDIGLLERADEHNKSDIERVLFLSKLPLCHEQAASYTKLMIEIGLLERVDEHNKSDIERVLYMSSNIERVLFLSTLQLCHDFVTSIEDMFHKLEDFRIKYNLDKAG